MLHGPDMALTGITLEWLGKLEAVLRTIRLIIQTIGGNKKALQTAYVQFLLYSLDWTLKTFVSKGDYSAKNKYFFRVAEKVSLYFYFQKRKTQDLHFLLVYILFLLAYIIFALGVVIGGGGLFCDFFFHPKSLS